MAGLVSPVPATDTHVADPVTRVSGQAASARAWHPAVTRVARLPTPTAIRALAAVAVTAAVLLAVVIAVVTSAAGSRMSAIGGTDAPEVTAATGLYFSLNDMDAQVANALLAGTDPALAASRPQYLATYSHDRETAYANLQQAAVTAAGNPAAQRQLAAVLDNVGQYEALAADSLLADQRAPGQRASGQQAPGTPGAASRPPAAALAYYRQATDLMRTGILPQVASLTAVNSAKLDGSYSSGRSATQAGAIVTAVAGLALAAALIGLQVFLARRFRRMINPALAAATLVAVALAGLAAGRMGAEDQHLFVAKSEAFDSIVALSQARAVSYAANADESRYLVDPARAAAYQQSFLAESQQLAGVGHVSYAGYAPALDADVRAYQADNGHVPFGGYLGAEFRNITFPGERAAAVATLLAYQVYEHDDVQLRALAVTNPRAAAEFDTGMLPGQSNWAFYRYDQALSTVTGINQRAFTAAVQAGEGDAAGWNGAVPAGGAVLIAILVTLGVRPRLAEYR